jgi:hypothetical protein
MREIRLSGSVEGVISNGHSYSDSANKKCIARAICRVTHTHA